MIYGTQEYAILLKEIIKNEKRHDLYEETVEHAERMSVHVMGDKPTYLLERARPREDDEVKLYRLENYEPTTKAGADKAIDIVSKIFNPSLSSIRWKDDAGDQARELKDYTLYYFPNYNSIVNFNKDVTLRKMIADPNALMAVKPSYVPEDQTTEIDPEIVIYGSANIYYYDRDHYLTFIKEEKLEDQPVKYYFDYYDKNRYIHFSCWYDESGKSIYTEDIELYVNGFKEIPAWFLRGKSKSLDNGKVVYESFFSSALPHWNLAIIHESDLLGAYITHMHPQKYEMTEDCGFQYPYEGINYRCSGGIIKYGDKSDPKSQRQISCPSCGGTGRQAVKSPYGVYQINRDKLEESPSGMMPVGYISIPVDATKMLQERCESMVQKGMWAINMDIEEKVGENQSGKAKVIDRSAQHDTLFTIGSVMFDVHLQNQYYFINKYKFKEAAQATMKDENKNLPEINKPTQFDIASTSELVNNYKVAKDSGLDRNFLRTREIEILSRDLSTNPDLKNYQIIMLGLDPLPGLTLDEIDLGTSKGFIRKVDAVIHLNLKPFMDRAIQDDKNFLTKEKKDQLVVFEKFAKELIESEKPAIDPNMMLQFQDDNVAA